MLGHFIAAFVRKIRPDDVFVFHLVANDVPGLKESEEKLKQQQQESARRENILVMRLATKEQEMQECTVCISLTLLLILFINNVCTFAANSSHISNRTPWT